MCHVRCLSRLAGVILVQIVFMESGDAHMSVIRMTLWLRLSACLQVDVGEQGHLCIDVAAARLAKAFSPAAKFAEAFPAWCSVSASEVFQFSWRM